MRLAVPLMLAQMVNVLYSVVDRVFIGHIAADGTFALTGVGVAFPIVTITTAFTNMCGLGAAPLFSMERGRKNDAAAAQIMGNSVFLMILFSALIITVVSVFKTPLLTLFGASEEVLPFASRYISIYVLGTFFSMFYVAMNPFINAQGFGTVGMATVISGAAVNIVLDYLFIYPLGMGVAGAAWATVISQTISALISFFFITGRRVAIRLRPALLRPQRAVLKKILSLGFTPFMMSITTSVVQVMYNSALQRHGGHIYVTAMTVILSVREVFLMGMHGVTHGAQPVISYNYGAGLNDRTMRSIRFMGIFIVIYSAAVWLLLTIFPGQILRVFNDDPTLLAVGPRVLRIFFATQVFMAMQSLGQNTFLALGMAKYGIFFSMLRKIVIVAPLILILPQFFEEPVIGVFFAEPISDVIGAAACFTTMYFAVWRKLKAGEPVGLFRREHYGLRP